MDGLTPPPRRLAALAHRDFALFWAAHGLSQVGTQIMRVAVAWQIYQLTHSPVALGLVGLFRVAPVILLALGAGVVADALDRRRLLALTETVLGLSSAALGALTLSGHISVPAIYALSFVAGVANAFDNPTRHALVPTLVPREDLPGALSLGVTAFQVASVVGPGVGGLLLAAGGASLAYFVDAASFLAVVAALGMLRHRPGRIAANRVSLGAAMEGLRFLRGQPIILGMMLLDFFGTLLGGATMLMPIFADKVLGVGVHGLGWLYAAPSVGAVGAALVMAWIGDVRARGRVVLASVAIYGLAVAAFGVSEHFWLSLGCLAVSGAADTVSTVVRQTVRQLLTPDALRGRMTSINMVFFMGGPQLGEVEAGVVAKWIGAPLSVAVGGIGCALLALGMALAVPSLRRHRA